MRSDLTGQVFGRWTVLELAPGKRLPSGQVKACWVCRCACGAIGTVRARHLLSGDSRSCGCLRREITRARIVNPETTPALRHGQARHGSITPEWVAWSNAKDRCLNPSNKGYEHWGGRGITMCPAWRDRFEAFLADVGPRPSPAHSLDRYPDNDGHYEPGNVRWATRAEQNANRRPYRKRERAS